MTSYCPSCGAVLAESDIVVSLDSNLVHVGWSDATVRLTRQEAEVLFLLREAMPRHVSKTTLITKVWADVNMPDDPENSLAVVVCRLREKIAELNLKIETVYKRGFALTEGERNANRLLYGYGIRYSYTIRWPS